MPAPDPHLLIFDLSRHAHLPNYLQFLVEFWRDQNIQARLTILVWHTFLQDHAEVVALAASAPRQNIQFMTLTAHEKEEKLRLEQDINRLAIPFHALLHAGGEADYAALYDWRLLEHYATTLKATHSLIIHIDHYLPLLAMGASLSVPVAGIYFAPTFHYPHYGIAMPETANAPTRLLREKFALARALRHPQLHPLFFLDPFALEQTRTFGGSEKGVYLADPIRMPLVSAEQIMRLRAELGADPQRRVFMVFGQLDRRKGVDNVLAALGHLSPDHCQRLCLLLVGGIHPDYQAQIEAKIEAVCANRPVQIVRRYGYAPQGEMPVYFHLADVVLTAYPQHFGMSGIQLLAAAAGTPVLSSKHGLMGELARRYGLGLTVDAADSQAIASAIGRFLEEDPASLCDPAGMRRLAEEHDGRLFGRTIVEGLGITVEG